MSITKEKAAFTIEEACTYIGTSRPTFYRLMDQGRIVSFHIGRRRMILREHLDRFLRERLAAAGVSDEPGA